MTPSSAHLRLSSPRVGGGSGSFVSPNGLLFTNHHVAQGCITKVSTAGHDYMKDGFFAATHTREIRCPDTEAVVLQKMEDVTAQVKGAVKDGTPAADAVALRRAAMARIEKECAEKTGLRCDVVTLFSGERYDLYQYKRYTDLRLVFAPEFSIAFFGGDPDNFTYPRYDYDITFLRAYENGKPASTPEYLKWSAEGAKEGEIVFVPGNPGSTSRLATGGQLNYMRDTMYPPTLARLQTVIELLTAYSAQSEDNRRAASNTLFSASNTWKGSDGKAAGLRDSSLMRRKQDFEQKLRAAVERDPKLGAGALKVWDEVAAAYRAWTPYEEQYQVLEKSPATGSRLFKIARDIVRLAEENAKPNDQRIAEYRESGRRSLEISLFSPAPVTESLEVVLIGRYLEELRKTLGAQDALVTAVLGGRTPGQAAAGYVKESKLADVAQRRQLAADREAVLKSGDGMIRLARLLDEAARRLRRKHEEIIETVEGSAAAHIASYRFRMFGNSDYPDATFTPRVAFGAVKGYEDQARIVTPWATTFGGLFRKATGADPYRLPQRWIDGKAALSAATPMNFVTTADITGGNSGSPTVNAQGEIVGIVFDGNIESLPNTFLYSEERARAVHVASQGIVEALEKIYKVPSLIEELGATRKKSVTD